MKIARIANAENRESLNSQLSYFICMKKATTRPDLNVAMPSATQMLSGPRLYWATQTVTPVRISRTNQTIRKVR